MMTLELMDNKPKRRDKLIIMMDILNISKKQTSKTRIMSKANLSYSQLNEYIDFLVNHGLLEVLISGGKVCYKVTKKGTQFIERQQIVIGMLYDNSSVHRINTPKADCSLQRNKQLIYLM
jgi:predicted transcriptional regulator